jgi:hypothetical protein
VFAFFRLAIYDSRPMAALLFCQCGSDRVDIANWNVARAWIKCFTCGREAWIDGFTVSEFDPAISENAVGAAALVRQPKPMSTIQTTLIYLDAIWQRHLQIRRDDTATSDVFEPEHDVRFAKMSHLDE